MQNYERTMWNALLFIWKIKILNYLSYVFEYPSFAIVIAQIPFENPKTNKQ